MTSLGCSFCERTGVYIWETQVVPSMHLHTPVTIVSSVNPTTPEEQVKHSHLWRTRGDRRIHASTVPRATCNVCNGTRGVYGGADRWRRELKVFLGEVERPHTTIRNRVENAVGVRSSGNARIAKRNETFEVSWKDYVHRFQRQVQVTYSWKYACDLDWSKDSIDLPRYSHRSRLRFPLCITSPFHLPLLCSPLPYHPPRDPRGCASWSHARHHRWTNYTVSLCFKRFLWHRSVSKGLRR